MSEQAAPQKVRILPILDYIIQTYMKNAKMPQGEEVVNIQAILVEVAKLKGKREAIIEYKRSLSPYARSIFDAYAELSKINTEVSAAIAQQNADEMTRGWFRIAALLMKLKLYRDSNMPIEKMDLEISFTDKEKQFLDDMIGMDIPFEAAMRQIPPSIVSMRMADIDKRQLVRGGDVIDEDYEEPLRKQIREKIEKEFGIERVGDFAGTKKPLELGDIVKPAKVKEEVVDNYCFRTMSQFIEHKYKSLRRATYKPLDIERKETGGYRTRRIKFKEVGGGVEIADSGMISAEAYFMDPPAITKKIVADISLLSQTLAMGAKKISTDYYFNVFYHIQHAVVDDDAKAEGDAAEAPPAQTVERFDPETATEFARHRDRVTAEKAAELINELAKYDIYVFGGHLDLDIYLDCIGIRKKPNIMMIKGEGLASFDYINNLILVPEYCPPRVSPLEQMVSALADFRYALWIDSPKNIFEQQGVGFAVIGSKKKAMSKKPLWAIFPTHCSALIKQKAFREQYIRHVLSHIFSNGIKEVCGYEIAQQHRNRITDSLLRQFFSAYIPMYQFKEGKPPEGGASVSDQSGVQISDDAAETEQTPAFTPGGMPPRPASLPPRPSTLPPKPAAPVAAPSAPQPVPTPAPAPTQASAPSAPAAKQEVTEDELLADLGLGMEEAPAPAPTQAAAPAPKPAVAPAPAAPAPKPAAAPAPAPTPAAKPATTTINCKSCHCELPVNSKFCLNCGAPVIVGNKCIICASELPPGAKFCNECGSQQS